MEALDRREWPQTDVEILMLRSCVFAAQATVRDMIAAGRGDEIEEIERATSAVAPAMPENL